LALEIDQLDSYYDAVKQLIDTPNSKTLETILWDYLFESDQVDFKKDYLEIDKIAKHILSLANIGGGAIILGVSEDGDSLKLDGLEEYKDNAELDNSLKKYIPSTVKYRQSRIKFNENDKEEKIFSVITVQDNPMDLPYISNKNGSNINEGEVYVRSGTKSERADKDDVEQIYRRKNAAYNLVKSPEDFNNTVKKLSILYSHIPEKLHEDTTFQKAIQNIFIKKEVPNENYPEEDLDQFLNKCIDLQKEFVLNSLG